MGGGTTKLFSNRNRGLERENITSSLFSFDVDNIYSATGQSIGSTQAVHVSDSKPETYLEDKEYGVADIFTLFLIICNFLKDKFHEVNNKKLRNFIDKLEIMNMDDNLVNCSEFKKFQKYCINKSIHQYHGYEIVRRFLTKCFSDYTGIFMKLERNEWIQYADRFLKKQ